MMPTTTHRRRGARWVRWTLLAFVILFVVTRPAEAADTATALVGHLVAAGDAALTFATRLGGN